MPICAGGGGIPTVRTPGGALEGVEAVVDKDRVSALVARSLAADRLLLLTDVDAVYENWRQEDERRITHATPDGLSRLRFESGSMAPKVAAAAEFVRATGRPAGIGRLEEAAAIAAGDCGTQVAASTASQGQP